jgi:multidrug resistance efflux pump
MSTEGQVEEAKDSGYMKPRLVVIVALVLLGGLVAAGWWFSRTASEQVVAFLVSGGLESGRAERFVALVGGQGETDKDQDILVASGSFEGETVSIVSEIRGRILELDASEGDQVAAGEVLVQLDTSSLEAQMVQVDAGVAAAQANLVSVRSGTHPAEILTARATLRQAIAQRDAAERIWQDTQRILDNPQEIEVQIVEAQTAVRLADASIEGLRARLAAAEVERDQYLGGGSLEEKQMYASLNYQVEAAQAAIDAARAEKLGAESTLVALRALRNNPLALVSQVHAAESQYELAAAGVGVAIRRLDELQAGPAEEDVAVAEAQVARAKAAGAILEAQLETMTLRSPIDGIVTSRSAHVGEAVLAGATLLTIANLDEVKLTIYVPEDELNRVYLGQEVEVQVDSFPGRVFTGTVSYISPRAEFTPKNVQTEKERVNMVFAVKVRLANPDHVLKLGMPADAILR